MYQTNVKKETKTNCLQPGKKSAPGTKRERPNRLSQFHTANQPKMVFCKRDGRNLLQDMPQKQNAGLPDKLKSGIESLSGFCMDDVKIHYNSSKPAQLQALAYTQGTEIHVAPGQEKCLAHEAWHVVQQMQGRVSPNMQMQGMAVNDDAALEHEADVMGKRAENLKPHPQIQLKRNPNSCIQKKVKYCGKTYDGSENNIGKKTFEKDIVLRKFYTNHGHFQTAMRDVKEFDLDKQLEALEGTLLIKIIKDYHPKDFFFIDNQNLQECFLRHPRSLKKNNVKEILGVAVNKLYSNKDSNVISDPFEEYYLPKIIVAMKKEYKVVENQEQANGKTGKNQNRFEYILNGNTVELSGSGTHYIYRSMELEKAKNLERAWDGWKNNFPDSIPDDFYIQNLGLTGHMGSFDQAFCVFNGGTPVEFEMKPGVTPSQLLVCDNISNREREANNREGIKASGGKLGIKTEKQGGSFSFVLPSINARGCEAKAVVWNFLKNVANIKVYYIRPESSTTLQ